MSNLTKLAIETSTQRGSVALLHQGECTSLLLDAPHTQAAHLVPILEKLLKDKDIWYSDITDLVITVGPGSFTGLRIGLAVARSITFAYPNITPHPCTTMQCLVMGYEGNAGSLLTTMKAGKGEIYTQTFTQNDGEYTPQNDISLCKPESMEMSDMQILGNTKELLPPSLHEQMIPPSEPLAEYLLNQSAGTTERELRPLYIRPPDAKLPTKPYL